MTYRSFICTLIFAIASPLIHAADNAVASAPTSTAVTNPTTLIKKDVKVGTGKEAVAGKEVSVNYTGWLYNAAAPEQHGAKFDSSIGRGPFTFPLGAGMVIKGWDQGVVGMKVGGKRTLIIPADMAYGKRGAGGGLIPPDAPLIFDVELLDVK
ncbi:MAG TPA: FKBP-type peptidyl-prolyl cis-trans isomerase [Burkholderiaceae bacterium]